MKKVVAFLVLVSIMVSNIVFQGYFVSAENVVETMAEVGENTNNYNKLHFYFCLKSVCILLKWILNFKNVMQDYNRW